MTRATVVNIITRLDLGGAQKSTLHAVARLSRNRYRVLLVTGFGGVLEQRGHEAAGDDFVRLRRLVHPISPLNDVLAIRQIAKLLRQENATIVHTHSSKAGVLGRLAARLAKTPIVVHTVHGWSFNDTQSPLAQYLYRSLERLCALGSDRLIAVSRDAREKGLRNGIGHPELYQVIHPGIDSRAFQSASRSRREKRNELGIPESQVVALMVAPFKPGKNHFQLIESLSMIPPRTRPLCVFAGDGHLRTAVEARAARLGVANNILCLGWRHDIPELMAAADVIVMPTLHEGLPQVCLQALAAGKPMVMTSVGGIPETLRDGENGYLVPPGRPELFAEALQAVTNSEALRESMGRRARELVDSEPDFDADVMVQRVEDLYDNLLETYTRSGDVGDVGHAPS